MHPYHILTDAAADLLPQLVKDEDIGFIPMPYTVDEEERVCVGPEPQEVLKRFYDCQRRGQVPRTTQISPQNYIDFFSSFAEKGEDMLYLCLSGGLSNTYNSALMAADVVREKFPGVALRCVDTRAATGGMGLLLEAAAQNRAQGLSVADNAAWLEEHRLEVQHWFMVEDLMYLKRGGRLSAATAMMGVALNIKPVLRIQADGTLVNFEKKRGSKGAMDRLVELYAQTARAGEQVYVIHADNPAAAEYLTAGVRAHDPDCPITAVDLGPVIGAHVGPGMCAVVHWGRSETARREG